MQSVCHVCLTFMSQRGFSESSEVRQALCDFQEPRWIALHIFRYTNVFLTKASANFRFSVVKKWSKYHIDLYNSSIHYFAMNRFYEYLTQSFRQCVLTECFVHSMVNQNVIYLCRNNFHWNNRLLSSLYEGCEIGYETAHTFNSTDTTNRLLAHISISV